MTKDVVFVLHGIGEYTDDWLSSETGAVPALKAAAKQYSFFQNNSVDSYVDFVPVLYDDIFVKIMKNWADRADGLMASIPVMPQLASDVLGFVQDFDEDNWETQFAADVVLYWGFRLFQQRISLRVLSQIVDKVNATATAGNETPDYHILAHSLGTAVAQDALHHLGTESWLEELKRRGPVGSDAESAAEAEKLLQALGNLEANFGVTNPFAPSVFTFESITMLSNVSGLIYANAGPTQTIVRPGTATEHGAYTGRYLNVNHVADPVSLVTRFQVPPDWMLNVGLADLSFTHFVPNDDTNTLKDVATLIHSGAHYMADPALHLRLLQLYVNPYRATNDDVKALKAFSKRFGPTKIAQTFKDAYEGLKKGDTKGLDKVLDAIESVKGLLNV